MIENDIYVPLKKIFGYSTFRFNQEEIIKNILDDRDVFVVMPTGGGKSLCYQLPSQVKEGITVVISPLISLMKDQVDAAVDMGIQAAYINSSLSSYEMSEVYDRLYSNELDMLYVSPERFAMGLFIETLKRVKISQFAIDEAHCISQWGHDFRPDYLSLSNIIKEFPHVPISSFTATATQKVQDDIIKQLGLRTPFIERASFNRPNLYYKVKHKENINVQILNFIKENPGQAGIVYRTTRQNVEDTADFLTKNGIKALPYHAGLSNEERSDFQEKFNRDNIDIMVATIAFGMGIDKSNIRFVIHGDLPKNIENYYQETGRSGRDGDPAKCLLFFNRGDIPKLNYFIEQIGDEQEKNHAREKLRDMTNYASVNVCRRKQILTYFNEDYPEENCGYCDVCCEEVEKIEATRDARIVLSTIARTNQTFGAVHIVDVIFGADTKKIRQFNHELVSTYSMGKDKGKKYWRKVIDELIGQQLIEMSNGQYPSLKINNKGADLLRGEDKFYMIKPEEALSKKEKIADYRNDLFEELRVLRKEIADEQDVPAYIVFSDKTLHEMCKSFPVNKFDFLALNGVGEKKYELYGEIFIDAIVSYLEKSNKTKVDRNHNGTSSSSKKQKKTPTRYKTLELLSQGLSYKEIARKRELAESTVSLHIEELILEGEEINIDLHLSQEKKSEIEKLFEEHGAIKLKPIIENSQGRINYEEARIARASMLSQKS